ncbi:MAG: ergothioneine biosynthesis protein EgtB [Gemmatimonadales bacterium]
MVETYRRIRRLTEWIAEPLSAEDQTAQSMVEASPVKWHRAHTTWFFETFVLLPYVKGYRPFDPRYSKLFNSYYNAVGVPFTRAWRGLVTRPGVAEVTRYRAYVDQQMETLLEARADASAPIDVSLVVLGLHHEQQHQELALTDLKHLLSHSPVASAYRLPSPTAEEMSDAPALTWISVPEGVQEVGHDGHGFAYDNEGPRHRVYLQGGSLASRLVTNGEYLDFIRDGGYRTPSLWLSDGWATVQEQRWRAPLYWVHDEDRWRHFTLSGMRPVHPHEPVTHVSFYEAEAFARWAGARLPSEFAWEVAARDVPVAGRFLEGGYFHPATAPTGSLVQLYGDAWQWTASPYIGYPGLVVTGGALGEYNAKFMANQMVLRGASCVTPMGHARPTYRNFFPPASRWQFSGIRLAR